MCDFFSLPFPLILLPCSGATALKSVFPAPPLLKAVLSSPPSGIRDRDWTAAVESSGGSGLWASGFLADMQKKLGLGWRG